MVSYFAIVHKDSDSAYGVAFPDLPGCFSAADDEDELLRNAQEALALFVTDLLKLPEPKSIEVLTQDPSVRSEIADGAYLIEVPLRVGTKRGGPLREPKRSKSIALLSQKSVLRVMASAERDRAKRNAGGSTGSKVASAAAKVQKSKSASKAEKSVAASALTQKGSTEQTGARVASSASKILKSKTASKAAKSAAASVLSQKTKAKRA